MSRSRWRHAIEYGTFRALRLVLGALPELVAMACGTLLGTLAGSVLRIRRKDVDRHLAWAFPDRSRGWRARVARAAYRHLGREAVLLFRLGGWSADEVVRRTRVVGFDAFRDAARREGVVLLTGHVGNWEIGGAAVAARGIALKVVAKGMANRRFEADLFAVREALGMSVIEMADAPRGVLRALRAGGVVGILGDQNAHRGGIFVPFFGRAAATAKGPAVFALRADAPVFVGVALRDRGWRPRYTVTFELLRPERTGDLERDVAALTAAYTEALERAVRHCPEQYFWQHRRWNTRPPEEPHEPPQVTTARSVTRGSRTDLDS